MATSVVTRFAPSPPFLPRRRQDRSFLSIARPPGKMLLRIGTPPERSPAAAIAASALQWLGSLYCDSVFHIRARSPREVAEQLLAAGSLPRLASPEELRKCGKARLNTLKLYDVRWRDRDSAEHLPRQIHIRLKAPHRETVVDIRFSAGRLQNENRHCLLARTSRRLQVGRRSTPRISSPTSSRR